MAGLVDGYRALLLLGHHLRLLLQTADDTVHSVQEVLLAHLVTVVAGGYQGSLIAYVGNVGTREARRLTGQEVNVHALIQLQRLQVYHKHLATLVQIGQIDVYLAVKTSGTQQGRVQHIGTVRGGQRDDTAVRTKAVHLRQQGVQRVLALIVAAHGGVLRAGTAHSVYLVNEDDARRLLLGFLKEITHTRGAHTHEHLYEVGTRHREERYTGLTGYGLGQQRLTRSRRTDQQSALGNLSAQLRVLLRVLQEVHNLLHLLLRTGLTGHVLERDAQLAALLVHLRLRLADTEDAATAETAAAAAHESHKEYPDAHDEQQGQQLPQQTGEEVTLALVVVRQLTGELLLGLRLLHKQLHLVHTAYLHLHVGVRAHLLVSFVEHVADVLGLDIHLQLVLVLVHHNLVRIATLDVRLEITVRRLGPHLCHPVAATRHIQGYQRDDGDEVDPVHVEPWHVHLRTVRLVLPILYVLVFQCLTPSDS